MKKKLVMSNLLCKTALYLILFGLSGTSAFADGSKDLYPSGSEPLGGVRAFLVSSSNTTTAGWPFTSLGTHYAYVKEGEQIAAAYSVQGSALGRIILTAPDGQVYSTTANSVAEGGRIDNRVQELAGPNVDGVTTGYVPFTRMASAGQEGLWMVTFMPPNSPTALNIGNVSGLTVDANWVAANQTNSGNGILAWDVSVISSADKLISGRVYANIMNLACSGTGRYYGKLFVLTNDGYVYKVDNRGIVPGGFSYFVNNKGLTSGSGDAAEPLYKSIGQIANLNIKDPRTADGAKSITHKMFYTFPDALMPVTASTPDGSTWLRVPKIIPAVTNISITGIEGTLGQVSGKGAVVKFNANMSGRYRINLTGPGSFVPRSLVGNAEAGLNQVIWDGKDGNGNVLTAGTTVFTVMVQLQGAEVHFPFIDVEHNREGVIIEQLNDDGSIKPGGDIIYWDDTNFGAGNFIEPKLNGNDGVGISSNVHGHKWGSNWGNERTMDTWAYVLGDLISQDATVVTKVADLAIPGITPNVAEAKPGTEIIYTVPVINHGPSDVVGAPFKFKAPTGFVIANLSDVTFAMNCGTAVVNSPSIDADGNYTALLDIPDGCTITFTIKGNLNASFSGANVNIEASIMRPADVTDPDATNPDPEVRPTDPHVECLNGTAIEGCNNIKYNAIPVASTADVVMVKSTAATEYVPGEEVEYTLTVRNDGPGDAKAVTVTDQAPTGTTISSWVATVTSGAVNLDATSGTGDLNQEILVLPNAAVVTYTLTLTVDANHTADLVNTAKAISSETADPNENNNTSTTAALTAVPAAPISGGTQSVCATLPVQTLTAMATVPDGINITWYDAPTDGNVVVSPVLSALGTVVFYAEANNGPVKSKSRTPVILSINASPLIDAPANQSACVTYTLPPITGTNLTSNQAYYTEPNGGGTKYAEGKVLNTIGTQTLYLFDKAVVNEACTGDIKVSPNTSFDNVLMHQILSSSHNVYPRAINPDFWMGLGEQSITYSTSEGSMRYLNVVGDLNIDSHPACTNSQVEITISATYKNEGPAAGAGYSGHISIANKLTGVMVYKGDIDGDIRAGVSKTYTITALVSAADLLAGNLVAVLGVETAQAGYKNWTLSAFKATYRYFSETPCPDEKSFKLTINPLPVTPVSGGDQIVCATNPIQTLTATATVPAGTNLTWYDAAVGGGMVATPTLNAIGTVVYYAESELNGCVSASRMPVTLKLTQTPVIDPIAAITSCGPLTLPSITGLHLTGNQAYYTAINKGGTKYNPGEVFATIGETTLYAYDEIYPTSDTDVAGNLTIATNVDYVKDNTKLHVLFGDQSRGFGKTFGNGNPWPGNISKTFLSFSPVAPGAIYSVMVGKAELPAGADNPGLQVLLSAEGSFKARSNSDNTPGYAGQLAIVNTATNQLLYQTAFSDVAAGQTVRPSVAGVVSTADLLAGNISIYAEFKNSSWTATNFTGSYKSVPEVAVGCPAEQSFKVNINPLPAAPIGHNQIACVESPIQTLTATATVPTGSTVVWYDVATGGTEILNPTLNIVGTKAYYAETKTGDCLSATRTRVNLTINQVPVLSIHNPAVVCHPAKVNLTLAAVTSGSTAGLKFTYFKDAATLFVLPNPTTLEVSGTYYIKGTNATTGCSVVAPVVVQFVDKPEVIAVHPNCVSTTAGSIKITAPLGAGFEYSIDDGANYSGQTNFINLPAGTYKVIARNTVANNCVSDVNEIIINNAITTATPIVLHPDCGETTGKIEFPEDAEYEYAVDAGAYNAQNIFNLAPGTYMIKSKNTVTGCEAIAIPVKINAIPVRPRAPFSSNKEGCEGETLTAEAFPDAGVAVVWYDAAVGGNIVTSPSSNTVGDVVYYAEGNDGVCTSVNRTVVWLTIIPKSVINPIADVNVCGPFTLPAITGANLSGNEAYYTLPGGNGTKYPAGAVISTPEETTFTLYAYDKNIGANLGKECPTEQSFEVLIRETTAGTIGANQTICKNITPAVLSSTLVGTGSGSIKYKWESSTTSDVAGFTVIAGATLVDYAPSVLNSTTWFRRTTISSYNGVVCESDPATAIKITVQDEVNPGTISASQTIFCNNAIPVALNSVAAATGSGTISYHWESSTTDDLTGFTVIGGATSANYSPATALSATTWFRRIAIATDGAIVCGSVPTLAIKVTVMDAVTAGTISSGQVVCNNTSVTLNSVTAGTGFGTISYRWESSTTDDLTGFAVVGGATLANYSPTGLTTTTWFRRITVAKLAGVTCESDATIATKIEVQNEVIAGAIGTNQTICVNTIPTALTSLVPGTGSGTISYRWEKSSASAPAFTVIPGEELSSYTPDKLTETTWFRRISISTEKGVQCESASTELIEITVQGVTSPGAITANQTICNGSTPEPLTSITAGTGSNKITYRWESSTIDELSGFTTINGATTANYAPGILSTSTWFRRFTQSTVNGYSCESDPTSVITITVQDAVTAGSIGTDQVICNNTIPAPLTSNAAGTGLGTISYRWESSTTSTATGFATIPGATLESYTPLTALTATTYFRRISISTDAVKCESAPAAVVTITVQDAVTAGVISGNQTICKGSVPTAFTSSTDGTGSGTLSYRWESSVIDGNTGFVTITGATGKGYTPAAVSATTYFRRVTISTEHGTECESVPTTALVVEINSAPIIANQSRTTEEDNMLNSQINGTDEEGDALTYSKNTDPTNGVAVVNADGSYTYMPNPGYSGNDSFTIAVNDGCEISIATITITVTPGPKPAITVVKTGVFAENYITYSFTVKNTGNVPVFDIMLTDAKLGIVNKPIDVPGGLLPGISITVTEKYVLSQEDKEAGTVTNTATVNAVDGRGTAVKDVSGTAEANNTATVTPVAKPLFAKDDHHEANANKVIKENVLVNDDTMGQDVNKLTVELITQPKNGKLVQNADGTFTYTPNPGFTGTDSYTYRIKDEYGYYSNVATVFFKTNFFDIKVPTLFTPDGDGINETFEIRGLNQFADNELIIVNRWGNEVYRMRNYQNNWNGEGLNEGTYYYLLRVKNTGDQEWVILKGYTTLVRGFRK